MVYDRSYVYTNRSTCFGVSNWTVSYPLHAPRSRGYFFDEDDENLVSTYGRN